jgi:hypothetical protein
MARIFTTPEAEQTAKVLMHNITVIGGLNTKDLRTFVPHYHTRASYISAAQTICDELINRDFANIDSALMEMIRSYFKASYDNSGKNKSLKVEFVAKAIVWFAEQLQLFWDDTIRTPYEIDEFKKTHLGAAVYKYGRYISAIPNKTSKSSSSRSSKAQGQTQAQPPKNGYKQSGPQSGNARDLKGTPGQKVYADTEFIYRIIGDNPQSKNVPNAFINPLSKSAAAGTTNKVNFSSGNGYSDCTCFFDDPNDANNFLNKIIQNGRVPANVTNPRVVKGKADSNGYFIVGTEFGDCAVSAKKLNEALNEAANEKNTREVNWEKATEGYSKEELDELHTWMRRD